MRRAAWRGRRRRSRGRRPRGPRAPRRPRRRRWWMPDGERCGRNAWSPPAQRRALVVVQRRGGDRGKMRRPLGDREGELGLAGRAAQREPRREGGAEREEREEEYGLHAR